MTVEAVSLRKKEEGRRRKEEGGRKKGEGRRNEYTC
jgi:hypothetical protein